MANGPPPQGLLESHRRLQERRGLLDSQPRRPGLFDAFDRALGAAGEASRPALQSLAGAIPFFGERAAGAVESANAQTLGELIGGGLPIVGDIQDVRDVTRGLSERDPLLAAAGAAGFIPALGGVASGALSGLSRAARAQSMGLERGFFRGGQPPTAEGLLNNQWHFTRDPGVAEGHARRTGGEVSEFFLPSGSLFDQNRVFRADELEGVLEGMTQSGETALSDTLREIIRDDLGGEIPGAMLRQLIEINSREGLRSTLRRGGFSGITDGTDVEMFTQAGIRDAERARLDPSQIGSPNVFAGVAGLGLLPALLREENSEETK